MTWTSGTWAEVAIGDDVLGADGYAWRVTDGLINRFGVSGRGESLRVTMTRTVGGAMDSMERTGDLLASKPVRYAEGEGVRRILSCIYCLRSDVEEPCKLHAPEQVTVERDGREAVTGSILDSKPVKYRKAPATTCGRCHPKPRCECQDSNNEKVRAVAVESKPFVEYDDAERAAAAALKSAGLQMTVIERQMTLDGLTEHIGNVHGEPLPGAGGNVTRIELRSRLADLHFALHEHDQPRGQRWEPRGSTAHVHPVMDRPMGDPEPTSFRAKR